MATNDPLSTASSTMAPVTTSRTPAVAPPTTTMTVATSPHTTDTDSKRMAEAEHSDNEGYTSNGDEHSDNEGYTSNDFESSDDEEENQWKKFTGFKIRSFHEEDNHCFGDNGYLDGNLNLYEASHYIDLYPTDLFNEKEMARCIKIIEERRLQIQLELIVIGSESLPPITSPCWKLLSHSQVPILKIHNNGEWSNREDGELIMPRHYSLMTQIFSTLSHLAEPGHLKVLIINGPVPNKPYINALCSFIQKNNKSLQNIQLMFNEGLRSNLVGIPNVGIVNLFPSDFSEALQTCRHLNTLVLNTKQNIYIQKLGKALEKLNKLENLNMSGRLCWDEELTFGLLNSKLKSLDLGDLEIPESNEIFFNNHRLFLGLGQHASLMSLALPRISAPQMRLFMEGRFTNETSKLRDLQITADVGLTGAPPELGYNSIVEFTASALGKEYGLPFHTLSIHFGRGVLPPAVRLAIPHIMSSSHLQSLTLRRWPARNTRDDFSFVPNVDEARCLADGIRNNFQGNKNLIRLDLGYHGLERMSEPALTILKPAILKSPTLRYLNPLKGETNTVPVYFIPLRSPDRPHRIQESNKIMYDHTLANRQRPLMAMLTGRKRENSGTKIWKWFHHEKFSPNVLRMIFSFLGWPQLKTLKDTPISVEPLTLTARTSTALAAPAAPTSSPAPIGMAAHSFASPFPTAAMTSTASPSLEDSHLRPLTTAFDALRVGTVATSPVSTSAPTAAAAPIPAKRNQSRRG